MRTGLLLLALVSNTGMALPKKYEKMTVLERFEQAYRLAERPQSKTFVSLANSLENHPLYPYLVQKRLMSYPYLANESLIRSFLKRHEGSPLDWPLRKKWLSYLKKQKQSTLFNEFYRPSSDTSFHCFYLQNQLSDGASFDSIKEQVKSLWSVGKSQPKNCDSLFKRLFDEKYVTEDLIMQRVVKAADGGNHTLLPYLRTLLSEKKKYLVDLWYRTRRSPASLAKTKSFKKGHPELEKPIILYGLKRLIWRDADSAISLWQKYQALFDFSPVERSAMDETLALRLSVNGHPAAKNWFEKIPHKDITGNLLQWYVSDTIRRNDWAGLIAFVEKRNQFEHEPLYVKYWYGMSLQQQKKTRQATKVLSDVAQQRHYYGFLASQFLSTPLQLVDQPLQPTAVELGGIEGYVSAQRAYALFKLEMHTEARREWQHLLSNLSKAEQEVAAVLAHNWGWHEQAISTFVKAGYYNDVKRRFPLAYKSLLVSSANSANIDPAWAFAIARKESAFSADARSSAGARGLMQLLPSTAEYISRQKITAGSLYRPSSNVKYGTRYLKYLLGKMGGNPVLATAAYNAGWRNVKKWAPSENKVRFDQWVETIPFKETRNYVKSVIAYHQIYDMMLDTSDKQRIFTELPELFIHRSDFGLGNI